MRRRDSSLALRMTGELRMARASFSDDAPGTEIARSE